MSNVRRLPGPIADLWDWQRHGVCRGRDSAQFFHPDGERGSSRDRRESRGQGGVRRAARSGPSAPRTPWPPGSRTASGAASPRPSGCGCCASAGRTSPIRPSTGHPRSTSRRLEARLGPATGPAPRPPRGHRRRRRSARREPATPLVPLSRQRLRARCVRAHVHGDADRVPAGGAVGCRRRRSSVCVSPALSVARTWSVCRPGVAVPRQRPLPPGVDRTTVAASVACCHGPPSTRTSTLAMPAVLRPGDAGDRSRPGGEPCAGARACRSATRS